VAKVTIDSLWEVDMRNRLVKMTLTFVRGRIKVMLTIQLHSTLNISETVIDRGLFPMTTSSWPMGYHMFT